MANKKLCIIGAGPSGLSVLYHLEKMRQKGREVPDVVCYEKASDWGGLWNYNWRTGTDENGEPVHGSMYRYLWSNGPKEALELPDYTFEDHFGKAIPSFPPREVLFDYLQGRWKKHDLKRHITFSTVVRTVDYNESTDEFTVTVENLEDRTKPTPEVFDYLMVASGHYSVPFVPHYPGIERFPGRVMHSHDFRDACEFKGKRILIVGASYSAEDIALQTVKYGAKQVICTYRNNALGFAWPPEITERPIFTHVEGNTIHFLDESTAEIDVIIYCTGYLHNYPYMDEKLRLRSPNDLYPQNLYKGTIFTEGGNNKLMYIAAQNQFYTFTMFDAQAHWAVKYLLGDIELPMSKAAMKNNWKQWSKRTTELKDIREAIDFQTDFVMDLCKEADYPYNLDVSQILYTWVEHKVKDILTYRDHSFASKFTTTQSPVHHTAFMTAMDDSYETFMATRGSMANVRTIGE